MSPIADVVNVVVFKFLKHYFTENNHYHNLHDDVHLFYTIYISFKIHNH